MSEARHMEANGASVEERIEQAEREIADCMSVLRRVDVFDPSRRQIQTKMDMERLRLAMLREGQR